MESVYCAVRLEFYVTQMFLLYRVKAYLQTKEYENVDWFHVAQVKVGSC
jgi:hypothetical protein